MYDVHVLSGYVIVSHQGSYGRVKDSLVRVIMTAVSLGGGSTLGQRFRSDEVRKNRIH